jgi:hypothetical protein
VKGKPTKSSRRPYASHVRILTAHGRPSCLCHPPSRLDKTGPLATSLRSSRKTSTIVITIAHIRNLQEREHVQYRSVSALLAPQAVWRSFKDPESEPGPQFRRLTMHGLTKRDESVPVLGWVYRPTSWIIDLEPTIVSARQRRYRRRHVSFLAHTHARD